MRKRLGMFPVIFWKNFRHGNFQKSLKNVKLQKLFFKNFSKNNFWKKIRETRDLTKNSREFESFHVNINIGEEGQTTGERGQKMFFSWPTFFFLFSANGQKGKEGIKRVKGVKCK